MNREEYLRELDVAGRELRFRGETLVEAASPLNMIRHGVTRDWKFWLPGASAAGFVVARLLRRSPSRKAPRSNEAARSGPAFWVPTLLKLLPSTLVQLVPLFLSLRSGRKP
ncbi:MAG: hypothetical protein JHD33_06070 [Chthoniobacterales bacterium]|jgi:hypothetical protein|nr:hypothetical protein [Chthoniobacterales bacterium]